ncbi:hypothetical protein F5884DRAFT_857259 [Xylogone sp. PMI_703]|nr:hypothetical protein F5884DRAFT_857259 [Xylogone sp. PMI_703]
MSAPVSPHKWSPKVNILRSITDFLSYICEICSSTGTDNPYITGVGYLLLGGRQLTAPVDAAATHSDNDVPMQEFTLYYLSSLYWVFPLHDACWRLFLLQVSSTDQVEPAVVKCLFRLLISSSVDKNGYQSFRQDLGGASNFQCPFDDPISSCLNTPWAFIYENPHQSIDISTLEPEADMEIEALLAQPDIDLSDSSVEYFRRFPSEIIDTILIHSSSGDIRQARLASRTIARASNVKSLPQIFWKSRFETQQISFITNRKRIWALMDEVANVVRLLIQSGGPKGVDFYGSNSVDILANALSKPSANVVISGDLNGDSDMTLSRPHSRGCKELERKWVTVPIVPSYSIGISTLVLENRRYICGLRIFGIDSDTPEYDTLMGLRIPEHESNFTLPSTDKLIGVEVAIICTGIVSLKFITCHEGNQRISGWFGEQHPGDFAGVGFSQLFTEQGARICGFIAGLDVSCKFVSFSLLQCQNTSSAGPAKFIRPRIYEGYIWKPRIPLHIMTPKQLYPSLEGTSPQLTFLNIDFGGMQNWVGLSAWSFYITKPSEAYGRLDGIERSFIIDGPKNERIIQIDMKIDKDSRVRWLEFYTNFDQEFCSDSPGTPVDADENTDRPYTTTLKVDPGRSIIGFIATEGKGNGAFTTLSIVTQDCDDTLSTDTEILRRSGNTAVPDADVGRHLLTGRERLDCAMSNAYASLKALKVDHGGRRLYVVSGLTTGILLALGLQDSGS